MKSVIFPLTGYLFLLGIDRTRNYLIKVWNWTSEDISRQKTSMQQRYLVSLWLVRQVTRISVRSSLLPEWVQLQRCRPSVSFRNMKISKQCNLTESEIYLEEHMN